MGRFDGKVAIVVTALAPGMTFTDATKKALQ
jgi:hypothetical protein